MPQRLKNRTQDHVRGREDEDDDGKHRVNAVFYFSILIRKINDLVTNF